MRIQGICKKYNIDIERVKNILTMNGYHGFMSSNSKIENKYLELFEIEFREDREKKEISKKMIEIRKNKVLIKNCFPKYKNTISNYNDAYNKAIKAYHSAVNEINHILKKIEICSSHQKQYWGLNHQECEVLVDSKYEQIINIVLSVQYILHSYDPENLYTYIEDDKNINTYNEKYNANDYLNTIENSNSCASTVEDDSDYLDYLDNTDEVESENKRFETLEKEEESESISSNDFIDWGSYHDASDNPWVNIFGMGDEAETAYWNTN